MGFTYFMLSLAASLCTGTISAFLYRAIFRPSGWTRKDNYGVAVRFKVFLPLYLQKPEKWNLMPDKARYDDNMTVYFSSGLEWRKYNRWMKRKEKERLKREQEERNQRFHEMIFKDYQTEPNPEFTPPPTVKLKEQKGELTNAERDKILADLMFFQHDPEKLNAIIKQLADGKEWGANPMEVAVQAAIEEYQAKKPGPRCKDCKHLHRVMFCQNGNNILELCGKHRIGNSFERVWPTMVACGYFEPKAKYKAPLETVQTHPLRTTEHYE